MEKKTVLIVGIGTQGSTVAKYIDDNPLVSKIICADRSQKAVDGLVSKLTKGEGAIIDATDKDSVLSLAKGADLVVNTMPFMLMRPTLDAAVEAKTNYQDFNAPYGESGDDPMGAIKNFKEKYDKPFREAGKTAVCGTGASPGLMNVMARHTMRYLDTCKTIMVIYHEGLVSKRFIPFWWSPDTALLGMKNTATAFVDGKLIRTKQYSGEIHRNWPELGEDCVFYDHEHPEPMSIGYYSKDFYKGVRNVFFKYGGFGTKFAKPLYDIGLLSDKSEIVNGQEVIPYELISKHLPQSPQYRDEIKEIIEEGILADNSAAVIESTGTKEGKEILVEAHVHSPGLVESFERFGMSAEMCQTGMSGGIFTRMILEGKFDETGVIDSDMLNMEQVDCFLAYAREIGHVVETIIKEPIVEDVKIEPLEE